jgi:hypothetical protein
MARCVASGEVDIFGALRKYGLLCRDGALLSLGCLVVCDTLRSYVGEPLFDALGKSGLLRCHGTLSRYGLLMEMGSLACDGDLLGRGDTLTVHGGLLAATRWLFTGDCSYDSWLAGVVWWSLRDWLADTARWSRWIRRADAWRFDRLGPWRASRYRVRVQPRTRCARTDACYGTTRLERMGDWRGTTRYPISDGLQAPGSLEEGGRLRRNDALGETG